MRRRLPWIWTGLVAVAGFALFLWGGYEFASFADVVSAAGFLSLSTLFSGLGALVMTRQPGSRISWLLVVIGFGILVDAAVQPLIQTAPVSPGFVDYLAIVLANTMWLAIFFPLFLLLFIFPTGSFLTRRWRWAAWVEGLMVATILIVGPFTATLNPPNGEWSIDNPIGFIPHSIFNEGPIGLAWSIGLIALALGGLIAMVVRFRRSSQLIRTQIKWVLYAALVFALVYSFSVVAQSYASADLIGLAFFGSIALIPISITAAIFRYKLFEIDRIISRTLSYAVVVALLAAVYIGTVTIVTSLLPTQNAIAVAGSTLLVAALFNPLRRRAQEIIDRRFNRSAYQAQLISDEFASKLRESLTVEELADVWTETVDQTLYPSSAGVWLNPNHR